MSLQLIDAVSVVDPVVVATSTPKFANLVSVNVGSGVALTPVMDTLYKTGAQLIHITGSAFPTTSNLWNTSSGYKLVAVTRTSAGVRLERILNNYIFSLAAKEIVVIDPDNMNSEGADAFLELRSPQDAPICSLTLQMVAPPSSG